MKKNTSTEKALFARIDKAVWQYQMFAAGDRVLMAVSGGADSMSLLWLLKQRLSIYGRDIHLQAVYIDLGFAGDSAQRCQIMRDYWAELGVEGKIVTTTIGPYTHSDENLENPCFLCSRIRRKHVFAAAEELICNKIVFGHHKDDLVETLLLNMIFGREISTSPPKLKVLNGKYHLVRPLVYVDEEFLKAFCIDKKVPTFNQQCPSDGFSKRQYVKELLARLEKDFPGSSENLFNSMKRVKRDYLL